jgi:hypothetical protein
MGGWTKMRFFLFVGVFSAALLTGVGANAATTNVDLDGNAANGAESQCELNVLDTLPVQFENKVTNKSGGDAFSFVWPSAGPGGFTSSVTPGSAGGVGAKWVWTTNQSVFSYTGSTCGTDVCFTKTEGPDSIASFCSYACLADGTSVTIVKGATAGTVVLSWTGGQSTFTIYRSTSKIGVVDPANAIGTTSTQSFTDTPPGGVTVFYVVRGVNCTTRKACVTDAECSSPGDGTCVSRGPFGVSGRSLYSNDVTVSSASLTSSLITFFSPPKEVFRVTSTGNAGGTAVSATNFGPNPVTVTTAAYPLGCCPAKPDVPHQLRCGEICVDYLNDPSNCGACGNVCGEGSCCSNGNCASLCGEGQSWCNGQCADLQNDSNNCGTCGTPCGDGTCCNGGSCASLCPVGQVWCNNQCVDFQNDSGSCGSCGTPCGDGTCCNGGACASLCPAGQVWCNNQCVDLQNDNGNCGVCGSACGAGTCCNGGSCESFCPAGQVLCGEQCVDFQNDSANCGTCGNACGDGTCCNGGACASVCGTGQTWCNGQCADFQNDSNNCGTCGNVCGDGTCCSGGICASVCGGGRTYCNGLCYDTQNDPSNCGACGNVCAEDSICTGGACDPCNGQGGNKDACDNRCVNLNTDPYNCGGCGISCNEGCPSGFTGVCSSGQSCRCVAGTPAPQPPSNIPPPTPPVCPNPHPSPGPVGGVCPNPDPSSPVPGFCRNPNPSSPVGGVCPNPDPSLPVPGYCQNTHPSSGPVPGVCPDPGPPAPAVDETATCVVNETTQTIPPGGSSTTCNQGGVLFKEVATAIIVCGDGIPGVNGECNNSTTKVTTGTFNQLVADPTKSVGKAYVTPYAVHITSDTSNDGLLEPGESANLVIDVLNAGPTNILAASATLSAPAVDLSDDGVINPVGITVGTASSSYGTILGTPVSTNCTAPAPQPASNVTVFPITVPSNHPSDTSHPFILAVTGTVDGESFAMSVPMALGIADRCDAAANTRDYDGVDGLSNPMAKLVPVGDPVPFPSKSFSAGNTRPLKVRVLCGGVNLSDFTVDAPEIVALTEATRGALDIRALNLNSDNSTNPNDPFFRFNNSLSGGQWNYNMRTSLIGTGSFTLTIRIAGRKNYVTGFVLQ